VPCEHLGLTGLKKCCDQGQCGACTVLVNGQRIKSCLALAVMPCFLLGSQYTPAGVVRRRPIREQGSDPRKDGMAIGY
jgi:xanthine dehydrogenase iron-sulfur cluster and FAD-binding subunit A